MKRGGQLYAERILVRFRADYESIRKGTVAARRDAAILAMRKPRGSKAKSAIPEYFHGRWWVFGRYSTRLATMR